VPEFREDRRAVLYATSWRWPSHPIPSATNGAMFRPVPCSAFREPSYFLTTRSTSSGHECRVPRPSLAPPRSTTRVMKVSVRCGPATPGTNPCLARSFLYVARTLRQTLRRNQTSSVMSVAPSGRFLPTRPRSPSRTLPGELDGFRDAGELDRLDSAWRHSRARGPRAVLLRAKRSPRCRSRRAVQRLWDRAFASRWAFPQRPLPATVSAGAIISSTAEAPRLTRQEQGPWLRRSWGRESPPRSSREELEASRSPLQR